VYDSEARLRKGGKKQRRRHDSVRIRKYANTRPHILKNTAIAYEIRHVFARYVHTAVAVKIPAFCTVTEPG
jgi:hypothetical protein